MVRWLRWHCPPDTGFEIQALAVWGRARYLSVTEAPHDIDFHTWMGKKHFCFFQIAETGNWTPVSGVKGSGANHYPRAPAQNIRHNNAAVRKHSVFTQCCRASVEDCGSTLKQHWVNAMCLHKVYSRHSDELMLGQRRRRLTSIESSNGLQRWPNIEPEFGG